jgi:hypothetical protein
VPFLIALVLFFAEQTQRGETEDIGRIPEASENGFEGKHIYSKNIGV